MPKKNRDTATSSAEELLNSHSPLVVAVDEDEKGDFPAPAWEEPTTSPSHPGVILRDLYLKPIGTTLIDFATHIGVSRRTVSMIVNGSRPISVDVANRLARALNTSPQFWLKLQHDLDIWNAFQNHRAEYERIEPLLSAEVKPDGEQKLYNIVIN